METPIYDRMMAYLKAQHEAGCNAFVLPVRDASEWGPKAQAIAKLGYAHFQAFNELHATGKKLHALGTLERAAAYLAVQS